MLGPLVMTLPTRMWCDGHRVGKHTAPRFAAVRPPQRVLEQVLEQNHQRLVPAFVVWAVLALRTIRGDLLGMWGAREVCRREDVVKFDMS